MAEHLRQRPELVRDWLAQMAASEKNIQSTFQRLGQHAKSKAKADKDARLPRAARRLRRSKGAARFGLLRAARHDAFSAYRDVACGVSCAE